MSSDTLTRLRKQLRQIQRRQGRSSEVISTGIAPLDRLFPQGGMARGTLLEWLSQGPGIGAVTLALLAAREACLKKPLFVFDRRGEFYPPAVASLGIDLARTFFVHPGNAAEEAWAIEQTLRCPGVGAVLACKPPSRGQQLRRFQLASETGGSLGLFVRAASAREEPSWAAVRLLVEPLPSPHDRLLQVTVLRAWGGSTGAQITLGIDDETGSVRVAAQLARPAAARSIARA